MRVTSGVDRFVEVNGINLHFLESGEANNPPLIMLHGIASLAHVWDFIVPEFEHDYRVLALDWRGHGESTFSPAPSYTYDDYVGDLEGFVSALGLRDVTFVGHSLGGYVALYYASRNPLSVRALVAADVKTGVSPEEVEQSKQASVRPHKELNSREEILGRFAASLTPTSAPREALDHVGQCAITEASPGKWIYRFDRKALAIVSVNPWPFLPQVKAPTLIMRGEWSGMMPRERAREMARGVANGRFVEIPESYHHLFLDKPDEFVAAIRSFLGEKA